MPSIYLPSSSTCPLPTCPRPRQTVGVGARARRDVAGFGLPYGCITLCGIWHKLVYDQGNGLVFRSSGLVRCAKRLARRRHSRKRRSTQAAVERRREPSGTPRTQLPGARGPASRPSLTRARWTPLRPVRYVRDPGVWSRSSAPTNSYRPRGTPDLMTTNDH